MTELQFEALIQSQSEFTVMTALKAVNTVQGAHRIARAELNGRARLPILIAADSRIEEFAKERKES